MGDRLYLSDGFRRDGTLFDIGQATTLKEHADALSVRQAISQSRKSRGFFATLLQRQQNKYRPTYNYKPDGSACRVYGTITAKKVTGEFVNGEVIDGECRLTRLNSELARYDPWPWLCKP